ncbi:MAG: hypothetical protein GQE15_09150 [Archangiaceae bacterium]|nr:hypothetical protein [Archangiaceae bacterium]
MFALLPRLRTQPIINTGQRTTRSTACLGALVATRTPSDTPRSRRVRRSARLAGRGPNHDTATVTEVGSAVEHALVGRLYAPASLEALRR